MKILSSYSIKGGVGKTALAVNLAFAFREAGRRTLLLNWIPRGLPPFKTSAWTAQRSSGCATRTPCEGLRRNIRQSDFPGLDIIPSNLGYRHFDILLDGMAKRRRQLREACRRSSSPITT